MEQSKRIVSLDILRGMAVLGILVMNIQSFSMPSAAYINPTAYGDLSGLNKWIWILSHLLASQKFLSIFSMLFGAGVFIFTENAMAYVGPGAGISLIGALVGLIVAVGTALWVLFSHPIKKALKKNKTPNIEEDAEVLEEEVEQN